MARFGRTNSAVCSEFLDVLGICHYAKDGNADATSKVS